MASFYRGSDIKARNSGQGGMQLRYRSEELNTDFGLYAIQYHDKNFQVQVRPGVGVGPGEPLDKIGEYMLVYPQDIRPMALVPTEALAMPMLASRRQSGTTHLWSARPWST